jgi:hypothetical protein
MGGSKQASTDQLEACSGITWATPSHPLLPTWGCKPKPAELIQRAEIDVNSARQYLLSVFAERAVWPEMPVKCLARDSELLAKLGDNRLPLPQRDPQLQRNVHRSQNRIEAYHQLRSALASPGQRPGRN